MDMTLLCTIGVICVFVSGTYGQNSPVETCFDKRNDCDGFPLINQNFCKTHAGFAKRFCRRLCGFCTTLPPPITTSTTTTTTSPTTQRPVQRVACINSRGNEYCDEYSPLECPRYVGFFSERCAQSCGYCDIDDITSGFHGKCLYKEKVYNQGETWYDGCDYQCTCKDGKTGEVECSNRCPVYANVPPQCTFVKKHGECCLQPVCNFGGVLHVRNLVGKAVDKDGNDVCLFKGNQYEEGSLVQDDCTYKCQCSNAATGNITCHDTCPKYDTETLPTNCHMHREAGACCDHPKCDFDSFVGSIDSTGSTSGKGIDRKEYNPEDIKNCKDLDPQCAVYSKSTCTGKAAYMTENCPVSCGLCEEKYKKPVPGPEDRCFHQGVDYETGDIWRADCLHECVCDDQLFGYYHCYSRCPDYKTIPAGCTVTQPADECACPEMVCDSAQNMTFTTTNIVNIGGGDHVIKEYPGGKKTPLLPPLLDDGTIDPNWPEPQGIVGCLHNGRLLLEGEISSSQNCSSVCQCMNEKVGEMRCYDRCSAYALDPACTLVEDPNDPCCVVPKCPSSVKTKPTKKPKKPKKVIGVVVRPDSKDLVTHVNITIQTTTEPQGVSTTPSTLPESAKAPPTMPPNFNFTANDHACEYKQKRYQPGESWVDGCDYNCICSGGPNGDVICLERCKDFICPKGSDCHFYQDPAFPCCSVMRIGTTTPTTTTTTHLTTTEERGSGEIPHGWLLLMKGVSGIPGDLQDLWTGNDTLNARDPKTQDLTPDHPVHYKSAYVERFGKCQFEKVRLSIYRRGVEKAWILFNATGADKNSWFESGRIESSSWASHRVQLKMANGNLNRQFEVLDTTTSACANTGWMFVSTQKGGCDYQTQVNEFHYSPLATPVPYADMERGDVLAITAQGGVCDVSNPQPLFCETRKNQLYLAGEEWQDGCDEKCNCTQVDKQSAGVMCEPLCEEPTNLHPGCKAVKKTGECCKTLVGETCHGGGKCWDKFSHLTRTVGETWRVNCTLECECFKNEIGYATACGPFCPMWNITGIPNCEFPKPRLGKCCSMPVCPGVEFDIPDKYKNDF